MNRDNHQISVFLTSSREYKIKSFLIFNLFKMIINYPENSPFSIEFHFQSADRAKYHNSLSHAASSTEEILKSCISFLFSALEVY